MPSVEQILQIRNELLQSGDLRAPQGLAKQLQGHGITEEAGRSLVMLFQVRHTILHLTLCDPVRPDRSCILARCQCMSEF